MANTSTCLFTPSFFGASSSAGFLKTDDVTGVEEKCALRVKRELACYPERRFGAILRLLCHLIYHNLFTACIGGKENTQQPTKTKLTP